MAKTKFTRANVRSSILKKIIIRADYQGFSGVDDTDKFISHLKTNWDEYFRKYSILHNKNYKVNLGKDGLSNFDIETTRIHRFSECRIGGSQAFMDITGKLACIEITCASPYEGSDGYLDCMARFIKILKDYDSYIELTRIGIRKYDYIFDNEASVLDNLLETNVWSIYQDSPHMISEKKEYKDFIRLDNGTLINLARIIEKVQINETEQYRLTFDADAYRQDNRLDNSNMRNLDANKQLLKDINNPLFDFFINTFKEDYINSFYNG